MKSKRGIGADFPMAKASNFAFSSNVKFWLPACCSLNIGSMMTIFGLNVPWGSSMDVVKLN